MCQLPRRCAAQTLLGVPDLSTAWQRCDQSCRMHTALPTFFTPPVAEAHPALPLHRRQLLPFLHFCAGSGPFQILVVMGLLVRIIHWAPALAGLGVTVALIPISALVSWQLKLTI